MLRAEGDPILVGGATRNRGPNTTSEDEVDGSPPERSLQVLLL